MDTIQNIAAWALQNLLWNLVMAGVGSLAATTAIRKGLGYLKSRQNLIWFASGSFVLILALSFLANQRIQGSPKLKGLIETVYIAQSAPRALVIIESISNSGSMPSSAYYWRVSVKHGGQSFDCSTTGLPDQINLVLPARGSVPQRTVTYYSKDSLAVKALSPIGIGAFVTGVLACVLTDVEIDNLKEGDEVMVSFNDVFQNTHTASIQGSSKYVDIKVFPGITQNVK